MVVEVGEYRCSSTNSTNAEAICALKDLSGADTGQSMPPVVITVDFGDGSGEQRWRRAAPADLWSHQYQLPGTYWVHVSTEVGVHCTINQHWKIIRDT